MQAGAADSRARDHDPDILDLNLDDSRSDATTGTGAEAGRARRLARLTWAFVGLGVVLRLVRYAMNFPLWGDESFVAVNFIAHGYRDLLSPLDYGQICPLLFLWIERWVVVHLGFSEWTLRLYPLACGVSSVFLFRHVAGRVVGGLPLLLAVAIFAVSFHPIRHAAEVKPYASDLLVALVLLGLALEWRRAPDRTSWLWLQAAVVPIALALSHPALFVAGGVSLGLSAPIWKRRRPGEWVPFLLYQVAAAGTFLGLFALFTHLQEQVALKGLRIYWADSFPPLDGAGRLARWLIQVHTGTMLAYPGGGRNGTSSLTFLAAAAGSILLWRRGRRSIVVMLLAPFALTLAAATLRRYPYGNEARQMQFVAPAICVLAGLGAAWLLHAIPLRRARAGLAALAVLLLAGFGFASLAGDVARPYRFLYDQKCREFARRFWPDEARSAELACLRGDFGIKDRRSKNLRSAIFLCNQWIYSPQRRHGGGPKWDAIAPDHPLRCVLYHETSPDHPEVLAWLARMRQTFDLRRTDQVLIDTAGSMPGPRAERLVVFEFVPKPGSPVVNPTLAGQGGAPGTTLR
jgi:hypothetical protein